MAVANGEWALECQRELSSGGGDCALSKSGVAVAAQFRWYHDIERPIDSNINRIFFMKEGNGYDKKSNFNG